MIIIPIIIFGFASLIMSVFYSIFKDKENWLGFFIRNITMLLLVVYAVVTINVTSIINGLSLFIAIAMAINMFYESLQTSKIENTKAKSIIDGTTRGVMYLSIALSSMSLASFSAYSLAGGLLLGLAIGMIVWAIKKTADMTVALPTMFAFTCLGVLIGLSINGILNSGHTISAILVMISSLLLLVSELFSIFLKNGKLKNVLIAEFKIIALILLIISIYMFK